MALVDKGSLLMAFLFCFVFQKNTGTFLLYIWFLVGFLKKIINSNNK